MRGARFSVLFPSRIVAICVSDPIGFECPRRMLSTPAMNVVATAPSPGVRMPSRPVAGAIDLGTLPEDDLANFFLRFDYDCARRVAVMPADFGAEVEGLGVGGAGLGSVNIRIGFDSMCRVAR